MRSTSIHIVSALLEDAPEVDPEVYIKLALERLPDKEVSLASPTSPGASATAPCRVVLHHSNRNNEWVTHLENMQVGGKFWGHYTYSYAEALADFKDRCTKLGVNWRQSTVIDD